MNKYKIIKLYFFLFLLFGYALYVNSDNFLNFYNSTLEFNIAITIMFLIGIIILLATTMKVFLLQSNLEVMNEDFYLMEKKDFNSVKSMLPENVLETYYNKIDSKDKSFSENEKEEILDFIYNDFEKNKSYISFTVETSLMLGLLGTFVGLLISIASLGDIVDLLVNMEKMDIKVVLESFGAPLKGMAVGFGSSLFGVAVAITLNLFIYILDKNFNVYIDKLSDFFNANLKEDTIEIKMEEQLKTTNKELVYTSEIYNILKEISESNKNTNKLLKSLQINNKK
jgi:biopolymer transport protein ExbB/TolQ